MSADNLFTPRIGSYPVSGFEVAEEGPSDCSALRVPACHSKVDFTPFKPLRAKIDRLDIRCFPEDLTEERRAEIRKGIRGGTVRFAEMRNWGRARGAWLQLNDPTVNDLIFLNERFYERQVLQLEIAVDAHLPDDVHDHRLLEALKLQLWHALYPQKHQMLMAAKRKCYDRNTHKYSGGGLGTMPLQWSGQLLWDESQGAPRVSVYIKVRDGNLEVGKPFVRTELRFEAQSTVQAEIDFLGMLPRFIDGMRANHRAAFFIADGFKAPDQYRGRVGVPSDPWHAYGAQWTDHGRARLHPDSAANKAVGHALNNLRTELKRIRPAAEIADRYDQWLEDHTY